MVLGMGNLLSSAKKHNNASVSSAVLSLDFDLSNTALPGPVVPVRFQTSSRLLSSGSCLRFSFQSFGDRDRLRSDSRDSVELGSNRIDATSLAVTAARDSVGVE